jgi:hypothetical protein
MENKTDQNSPKYDWKPLAITLSLFVLAVIIQKVSGK